MWVLTGLFRPTDTTSSQHTPQRRVCGSLQFSECSEARSAVIEEKACSLSLSRYCRVVFGFRGLLCSSLVMRGLGHLIWFRLTGCPEREGSVC